MRVAGHPLHPMLVHFPIALWSVASFSDALLVAGVPQARAAAWLSLGLGCVAALPAMVAGLIDIADVPESRMPVALRHMALMGIALLLNGGGFLLACDGFAPRPVVPGWAIALAWAGFGAMAVGAWHGGQLVYRFGVGVDGAKERCEGDHLA